MDRSLLAQLVPLLEYPKEDLPRHLDTLATAFADENSEVVGYLKQMREMLPTDTDTLDEDGLHKVEEIFCKSFDVQSITTLDIGYVMFGDDYKRAEVLVNLSRELKEAGIEPGFELPDHLTNVLKLLAVWTNDALATEFAQEIGLVAIARMIDEFDPARTDQRDQLYKKHYKTLIDHARELELFYSFALRAVQVTIAACFELPIEPVRAPVSDFLQSVGREMEIEEAEERRARGEARNQQQQTNGSGLQVLQ